MSATDDNATRFESSDRRFGSSDGWNRQDRSLPDTRQNRRWCYQQLWVRAQNKKCELTNRHIEARLKKEKKKSNTYTCMNTMLVTRTRTITLVGLSRKMRSTQLIESVEAPAAARPSPIWDVLSTAALTTACSCQQGKDTVIECAVGPYVRLYEEEGGQPRRRIGMHRYAPTKSARPDCRSRFWGFQ